MGPAENKSVVLGIDLGPNSIGWALVKKGRANPRLIDSGVRVFEAGLSSIEQDGKGKSRNLERRLARQTRRLLERRSRRMLNLAHALQRTGLLPPGNIEEPAEKYDYFLKLDRQLDSPYILRARALDKKLQPYELGRALYHLGQRRGFLSTRKSPPKSQDDEGKINADINILHSQMHETGARTLGELFATLQADHIRVRERYTSRAMYQDEFSLIWGTQAQFHADKLTEELRREIHRIIFHQRPLKTQKHLVGACELEIGKRRAPWALLAAQGFRYLQLVNNLRIVDESTGEVIEIDDESREALVKHLETEGDLTFPKMRRILGLKRTVKFNLELGGEKRIPGNRTTAKLIAIFGFDGWQALSNRDRDTIVEDIRSIVKDETLKRRAMRVWDLGEEAADRLGKLRLEDGYCRYSQEALEKLLPLLKKGTPLQTAIKERFPERWERAAKPHDLLPPVNAGDLPELRNPIVERALTELRRVVNAIVKHYGKPAEIHIELARELRSTAKQRERIWRQMRANERARERAAQKILGEVGIENPKRSDILKILLAEECNWQCPYTGRQVTPTSLFGDEPQLDIEHIIPFDRCLDDSYMNKTLCQAEENRTVKHHQSPFEAYHTTNKWDEIIQRVSKFKGNARREKLRRFRMDKKGLREFIDGFTSRQLNDTRWAAKWAKRYLGLLYGGADADGIDASGKRRVQATTGPITAYLRNEWGLNAVLGNGPGKSRDDHRHHAVDAVIVALTAPRTVKQLNDAAKRTGQTGRRLFDRVEAPWPGFLTEVSDKVNAVVTSHRLSKRVRGPLHAETFYGKPRQDERGRQYVHQRIHIPDLKAKDVDMIVDPAVRQAIRKKVDDLGGDPARAFADRQNYPTLETPDGRPVPIRRVRVRRNMEAAFKVAQGVRTRFVQSSANHHMEIVAQLDEKGNEVKWEGHVVTMYESYRRLSAGEPVIRRQFGTNKRFKFSLACGEVIELDGLTADNARSLYVVRTVPQSRQIRFVPINDARKLAAIPKKGQTAYPETLRNRGCRKMLVAPLGEIQCACD